MDIIDKLEKQSREAAELIIFEIKYIPGETTSEDMYSAFQKDLNITTYGQTESQAIISARNEAVGRMMEDTSLRRDLVAILSKRKKIT